MLFALPVPATSAINLPELSTMLLIAYCMFSYFLISLRALHVVSCPDVHAHQWRMSDGLSYTKACPVKVLSKVLIVLRMQLPEN